MPDVYTRFFPLNKRLNRLKQENLLLKPMDNPQYVKFQLVQDKCEAMDAMQEGETIKVYFDLRGREWQGKYFTNLQAWKLEYGQADFTKQSNR